MLAILRERRARCQEPSVKGKHVARQRRRRDPSVRFSPVDGRGAEPAAAQALPGYKQRAPFPESGGASCGSSEGVLPLSHGARRPASAAARIARRPGIGTDAAREAPCSSPRIRPRQGFPDSRSDLHDIHPANRLIGNAKPRGSSGRARFGRSEGCSQARFGRGRMRIGEKRANPTKTSHIDGANQAELLQPLANPAWRHGLPGRLPGRRRATPGAKGPVGVGRASSHHVPGDFSFCVQIRNISSQIPDHMPGIPCYTALV